MFNQDHAF